MDEVVARAFPRAGLLGNPSDLYGGRVIAFTFADFRAEARVTGIGPRGEAAAGERRVVLRAGAGSERVARSREELAALLRAEEADGGARLLAAALARFERHCAGRRIGTATRPVRLALSFESDVPRQVGLAGSSAVIVAALRALAAYFEVELSPAELAELALRAETDELGLTAGPQDRVVQAWQGLVHMDFSGPSATGATERLDPRLLPPVFVAWDFEPGASSGEVHDDVLVRFRAGEERVVRAIGLLRGLADEGRACLEAGALERLRELVDLNFDTRAAIWTLSERDLELVAIGRRAGAAVKLTGSGGAVLGVARAPADLARIERAYAAAGYPFLVPEVVE